MAKEAGEEDKENNLIAKNTGINPLPASISRVINPNFFPITLETLVAPRLPLPSLVRSGIPLIFAITAEVGKLPIKYDAII